jgi:hypothetical protein
MSQTKAQLVSGTTAQDLTVDNINTTSINSGQTSGRKNLIINGAMQVSQRGTSTTTNGYLIDRFRSNLGGMDQLAFTMSQSTDAPSGFRKSLKFDVTTAETGGVAADEYGGIRYITESQDVAHLLYGTSGAKTITLSFHVKAYQAGTYALNLFMGDTSRAYTTTYTISQSATWEKKTLTFVGDTGGSEINVDNGHGLYINWFFAAGSTFNSSSANTNQWADFTNAGWANGQGVDLTNSTNNYFQLTGVQLEVGSTATDFEHRSFGQELALCQRYYSTSYSYGTAAGTATFDGSIRGESLRADRIDISPQFKVTMRAAPTVTIYSPNSGSSGNVYFDHSVNADRTAVASQIAMSGFSSCFRSAGDLAHNGDQHASCHYVASAEL